MTEPVAFGRLEPVDLRAAWEREHTHFTPWLAREENLALLGATIGIELELQAQEQMVGPFRADLLCKDTTDGSLVLIENQIERTDHSHLGQVITYAAGLEAVTIVWIARRFTEEHRAALDWLNEVSHEKIRFFGLEVELWRIGTSPIAPKFNVIARPNDWSKTVREAATGSTTELQAYRYEFWASFLAHLERQGTTLSANRKPSPDHWMTWGLGKTGFHLSGLVGFRDKYCVARLVLEGGQGHGEYFALLEHRSEIETALSTPVVWDRAEDRKASYIAVQRNDLDPMDRAQWPEIHAWLQEKLEEFDRVFRPIVKKLEVRPAP